MSTEKLNGEVKIKKWKTKMQKWKTKMQKWKIKTKSLFGHSNCTFFPTTFLEIAVYAYHTSPYICVTNNHVYIGSKRVVVWDFELYLEQYKPLHVRCSWKLTSVWIKHGRNYMAALVWFLSIALAEVHGGCWLADIGFVGIRGLSPQEILWTLLPKCGPKHGRKLNCTTRGYDRFC